MTPKKRGPGQPPHAPTSQQRKMVESMSAYGIPQDDISKVIGISIDTLAKHYREELDTAYVIAAMTTAIVLPWFGYMVTAKDAAGISAIFTVVSLARSYLLRRAFNRIG